ncbi:MAG: hypothetical protein KOO62_00705 [candidate division Zixibacteria bacterium]|nr:hypothetical protein [candidate division Zixibacteria bacterium]
MKKLLKTIWHGWMKFALVVGRFNTLLLLTLFYFVAVAPMGLCMRLFGWDPLDGRRKKSLTKTNWKPVRDNEPDQSSLRRLS